jgi:hypothetical protein
VRVNPGDRGSPKRCRQHGTHDPRSRPAGPLAFFAPCRSHIHLAEHQTATLKIVNRRRLSTSIIPPKRGFVKHYDDITHPPQTLNACPVTIRAESLAR